MKQGFELKITDKESWSLISLDDSGPFVSRLASILRLSGMKWQGHKKVYVTRGKAIKGGSIIPDHFTGEDIRELYGWTGERMKKVVVWKHGKINDIILDIGEEEEPVLEVVKMINSLYPVFHRVIESGGLPMHAGLSYKDGAGILIAARGGTGKTTTCRRISHKWPELCDDMSLIAPKRDTYEARPFPTWSHYLNGLSGMEREVNRGVPLEGIYFLVRSDSNHVEPLPASKASLLIYDSCCQISFHSIYSLPVEAQPAFKKTIFYNAYDIAKKVPAYLLYASLEGDLCEVIDHAPP